MSKNPYSKRTLGGPAKDVDEDAVAKRYDRSRWSVPQCAAAFGIGDQRVRSILRRQGIELRGRTRDLDPGAVVRAYGHFGDYTKVAHALGVAVKRVTAILDEAGVPHGTSRLVSPQGSLSREALERRAAWQTGPTEGARTS
jgi:hypothetical protein